MEIQEGENVCLIGRNGVGEINDLEERHRSHAAEIGKHQIQREGDMREASPRDREEGDRIRARG